MKQRFLSLDIMRGLSAILIVLYHYTIRYNENPLTEGYHTNWSFHCSFGFAAVTTFFVMSGFFSGKILIGQLKSAKAFLKRLNRLLPTFWTCATISAVLLFCIWKEASVSLVDYLGNLTMLPGLLRVKAIDGAYWTLQLELFWALWVSFLLKFKNISHRLYGLLVLICFSIVLSFFNDIQHPVFSAFRVVFMTSFSSSFIAGTCLWIIQNNKLNKKLMCTVFCFCVVNQILQQQTIYHDMFFFASVFVIFIHKKLDVYLSTKNIILKFLVWIASFSYPLYLLHQMIGFAIIWHLRKLGIEGEWMILVPIGFNVVLAFLIHNYIEKNKSLNVIKI